MRVTQHNGRKGKKGVYAVKHNDRNFDVSKADHIDQTKSCENIAEIVPIQGEPKGLTFEEHEKAVYDHFFTDYLSFKNDRCRQQRHPERCQTIEEYRTAERTCPEETIYQIGCADNHPDPIILKKVFLLYMDWHWKTYPLVKTLDYALHMDETTHHIHERHVWAARDPMTGCWMVSQAKALEQMDIERPDTSKPVSRTNNAKMTYTRTCRAKLEEICRKIGISLTTERLEASKTGKDLVEWQLKQDKAKRDKMRAEIANMSAREADLEKNLSESTQKLAQANAEKEIALKTVDMLKSNQQALTANINTLRKELGEIEIIKSDRETLPKIQEVLSQAITQIHAACDKIWDDDLVIKQPLFARENEVTASSLQNVEMKLDKIMTDLSNVLERLMQTKSTLDELSSKTNDVIKRRAEEIIKDTRQRLESENKRLNEKFNKIIKNYQASAKEDIYTRLRQYCQKIKFGDGTTVLAKFDAQVSAEISKMREDYYKPEN